MINRRAVYAVTRDLQVDGQDSLCADEKALQTASGGKIVIVMMLVLVSVERLRWNCSAPSLSQ